VGEAAEPARAVGEGDEEPAGAEGTLVERERPRLFVGFNVIPPRFHGNDLRLTEDEQAALGERAESEGISTQEAARRAVRDYVAQGRHGRPEVVPLPGWADAFAPYAERLRATHKPTRNLMKLFDGRRW
jgi:hypothetical protein